MKEIHDKNEFKNISGGQNYQQSDSSTPYAQFPPSTYEFGGKVATTAITSGAGAIGGFIAGPPGAVAGAAIGSAAGNLLNEPIKEGLKQTTETATTGYAFWTLLSS